MRLAPASGHPMWDDYKQSCPRLDGVKHRSRISTPLRWTCYEPLVAAFSEAAWVQNARATGAGTLGRGRNVEQVRLVELPVEERGPVLRGFLRQVRGGVRFFGSADPDVVVAAADRYPVFRLDSN
jgi:hypothetical protein